MSNSKVFPTVCLLAPFIFSFAFAMDVYIPVVPEMQQYFHTTQAVVQLTLSLFMIVTGLGQLFMGPITDQYGRRKLIFFSIIAFICNYDCLQFDSYKRITLAT